MKKLLTALVLILLVGVAASVVASLLAKKRLAGMSDDEIREFLAAKLEGKVGGEQLATIQEAAITGIRKASPSRVAAHGTDTDSVDGPSESADESDSSDLDGAIAIEV
jgi:hypothetical protein